LRNTDVCAKVDEYKSLISNDLQSSPLTNESIFPKRSQPHCSPALYAPVSLVSVSQETTDRSASLIEDRACGRKGRIARGTDHHLHRLESTGKAVFRAVIQLVLQ
jgi:hypothetical protein